MNREEFSEAVERVRRERPNWLDLPSDELLIAETGAEIEATLGVQLPSDYVWFLTEYGGGDFGLARVYSGDPSSDLFVLANQGDARSRQTVAFSDDGTGNAYVFPINGAIADDRVHLLDHESGELRRADGEGFLDWLADVGLSIR